MTAPTTGGAVSILEPIMVARLTGIAVPATMAQVALQDGVGAPLRGIMDREVSAVSEAARPRGAAALGAQRDGEEAVSPGVAALALSAELMVAWGDLDGDQIISSRPSRSRNV